MTKNQRQSIIETELSKQGYVLIASLGERLGCSEETIRRDLKEMEQAGKLTRIHGGAYLVDQYDVSYPVELRRMQFPELKHRLALAAIRHIRNNEYIMLDSSTTCLALASELISNNRKVTLITNSLLICELCNNSNSQIKLICTGGEFRRRTSSFTDYHTIDTLSGYHADRCFVSPPKVTTDFGLTDNHLSESRVRECMIRQSESAYLVVDHTKFSPSASIRFDGLDRIRTLITDMPLNPEWESYASSHGIRVEYCSE